MRSSKPTAKVDRCPGCGVAAVHGIITHRLSCEGSIARLPVTKPIPAAPKVRKGRLRKR
jgi:hypothetical protein